jgi:hypothetical protein
MPDLAFAGPNLAAEIANGDRIRNIEIAREYDISPETVWRWSQKGLPGAGGHRVRLEFVRVGKVFWTSRAAVKRFFSALPSNSQANGPPMRSPNERQRAASAAMDELERRFGI